MIPPHDQHLSVHEFWVLAQLPRRDHSRVQSEAYDPKLDVDFTPMRESAPAATGFGQST
ncbi:hypothetical protein V1460_16690 [Streptomyces sp. SCSIO 30461]|uniref:hypothetical protein n=1 Tax=Streptomyces sp. SCSIO 30461 TaxID=3118085 RepID=UPI0030D24731